MLYCVIQNGHKLKAAMLKQFTVQSNLSFCVTVKDRVGGYTEVITSYRAEKYHKLVSSTLQTVSNTPTTKLK